MVAVEIFRQRGGTLCLQELEGWALGGK